MRLRQHGRRQSLERGGRTRETQARGRGRAGDLALTASGSVARLELAVSDVEPLSLRAGFWRRAVAFLIDALVIFVPFQVLVVALYASSDGAVQMTSGITFTECVNVTRLPEGFDPPPPAGANFARLCRASFFGLETARWVVVGRATQEGTTTKTITRSYAVSADGKPKQATSIDTIAVLALFLYLILLEWRFGAALGKRLVHVRVIDVARPDRVGIALRGAVLRNVAIWGGLVVMAAVLLVFYVANRGDPDTTFSGSFFSWLAVAGVLAAAFYVWIFVHMVARRDPIYDQIAGTAVVHRDPQPRVSSMP
jgi:uncharacterized RDD family membrane protein YckC